MDAHKIALIAEQAAMGVPQAKIAEQVGIDQSNVSRAINRDEIRQRIEEVQARVYSEFLSTAVSNIGHAITNYQKPGKKIKKTIKEVTTETEEFDEQLREHGYKASVEVLKGAGIFPTQVQSIYITQINQTNITQVPPVIADLLKLREEQFKALSEQYDVLEGEIVGDH